MSHPLLDVQAIAELPELYLRAVGIIFARFDDSTQDSGNIAYGVQVGGDRYFVKTAGQPGNPRPYLTFDQRVELLRNAIKLQRDFAHPALPRLHQVIESPQGPLLCYTWVEGELVGVKRVLRDDPQAAFQRFRRLPAAEILQALDVVYAVHAELAQCGWIACDLYDGCLIYDFARHKLHLVDLDTYHAGPFTNEMGRMFGSSRFMAPEEFVLGALIDERTTTFTLGRMAAVFLGDGTLNCTTFRGNDALYAVMHQACQEDRQQRFASVAAFYAAWQTARSSMMSDK